MIKIEGFLVIFNTNCKRDIVDINHSLFGRIASTNKGKYYYRGRLEDIKYSRLTNGCYFVEDISEDLNGKIKITRANIDMNPNELITAKDHWKNHIKINNLDVKNIAI